MREQKIQIVNKRNASVLPRSRVVGWQLTEFVLCHAGTFFPFPSSRRKPTTVYATIDLCFACCCCGQLLFCWDLVGISSRGLLPRFHVEASWWPVACRACRYSFYMRFTRGLRAWKSVVKRQTSPAPAKLEPSRHLSRRTGHEFSSWQTAATGNSSSTKTTIHNPQYHENTTEHNNTSNDDTTQRFNDDMIQRNN